MSQELGLNLKLDELNLDRMDFDKKKFRPFLRIIGRKLQKSARIRVDSQWTSRAGTYPGKKTGALQKAIRIKYFRSGFGLKLQQDMPRRRSGDTRKQEFYPAFLRYGVKNKKKGGYRIESRKNYIEDAFNLHREETVSLVAAGLDASLKGFFEK